MVRLDHSGVQLGRGRAARHADDGRACPVAIARPSAKNAALRSSRRTCVRRRSASASRQRGRARTGTDHRIGDPEPGPLVHQGGAERGLYAHPSCHSMSKCAARVRPWSCCMDSHRPVGSGVASDEHLAEAHTLVAVDLPGHGGSDSVRADLPTTAALVAESVRAIVGDEPCDLLGYSLGARVALHVVTGTDLALRQAVFIGVTGGIEDTDARARRRRADEAIADELETAGDVDHFLEGWLRGPLFGRLSSEAADRAERLRNSASGLASSLRLCGTGTQVPLWDRLSTLRCPALAMAGTDDARFAAHALRIARQAPPAVASLVPGGRSCRASRAARADVEDRAPLARSGASPSSYEHADGEQCAGDDLKACGRAEHRQERPSVAVARGQPYRVDGQRGAPATREATRPGSDAAPRERAPRPAASSNRAGRHSAAPAVPPGSSSRTRLSVSMSRRLLA